jgi:DNA-binding NarL/FixJ family response regulator
MCIRDSVHSILKKLDASSRHEAAAYVAVLE